MHYPKEISIINILSTVLCSLLDKAHIFYLYLVVSLGKILKTFSDPLVNSDGLEPNFFQ